MNWKKKRIFVVDDEPALGQTLSQYFIHFDAEVTLAMGFRQAQEIVDANSGTQYDVVLCDLSMPDGSYKDVFALFADTNPKPLYVLMTGNIELNIDFKAQDNRIDKVLLKPFNLMDLDDLL